MRKQLNIIIERTCSNCPYEEYDGFYSMSRDSGHDCGKTGKRIANDGELKAFGELDGEYWESQSTLFPMEERPVNPMLIPDWCPLEDAEPKRTNNEVQREN